MAGTMEAVGAIEVNVTWLETVDVQKPGVTSAFPR